MELILLTIILGATVYWAHQEVERKAQQRKDDYEAWHRNQREEQP